MMQRTAPNGAVPACRKSPPAAAFSDKTRFPCACGAAGETCKETLLRKAQTVEKPLVLERAAFLASFGRSQRSRKMLRHKALGLCPKPRQARREARALWALGPKAQSDPKRGSETMSATVREARMIEQPGRKKRGDAGGERTGGRGGADA